jgi:hypothetical protein
MVAAARYPLVEPTFPNRVFPALPGYDYHESFTLAGLPTLTPPVSGNIPARAAPATGGLLLFDNQGHFPVFNDPDAIAQWTGFMRSLAYDPVATIPARPMPLLDDQRAPSVPGAFPRRSHVPPPARHAAAAKRCDVKGSRGK